MGNYFELANGVRVSNNDPIDGDRYLAGSVTERDNIHPLRLFEGLQVYVSGGTTEEIGLYILTQISPLDWSKLDGLSGSTSSTLSGLTDTVISNLNSGETLIYNNGIWINSAITNLVATNAITINNDVIELGGELTKDTIISNSGYNYSILGDNQSGGTTSFNFSGSGLFPKIRIKTENLSNINGTEGFTEIYTDGNKIVISEGGNEQGGFEYASDYSSVFVNRSLIDKEYADNLPNIFVTGATLSGNSLELERTDGVVITTDLSSISDNIYVSDGTLVNSRTVNANNHSLAFNNLSWFGFYSANGNGEIEFDGAIMKIAATNSGEFELGHQNSLLWSITPTVSDYLIKVGNLETKITDQRVITKGFEYSADYSAGFTNRTLVDKEYVDNLSYWTSGSTGISSIQTKNSNCLATGDYSSAKGYYTTASGDISHSEGSMYVRVSSQGVTTPVTPSDAAINFNITSFIVIDDNIASGYAAHTEGQGNQSVGDGSHTEGAVNMALGDFSHAEGAGTFASGFISHSEGDKSIASGITSHAEGSQTQALGNGSHSEGNSTIARGGYAHSEGDNTEANGDFGSHSEGSFTIASGSFGSHSQGLHTHASGRTSHASGIGNNTLKVVANGIASFAHYNQLSSTNQYGVFADYSSILGGTNGYLTSTATNSVLLGGYNLSGDSSNTVYVPKLNINELNTTSLNRNMGLDSNGNVVEGSEQRDFYFDLQTNLTGNDLLAYSIFPRKMKSFAAYTDTGYCDPEIHLVHNGSDTTVSIGLGAITTTLTKQNITDIQIEEGDRLYINFNNLSSTPPNNVTMYIEI